MTGEEKEWAGREKCLKFFQRLERAPFLGVLGPPTPLQAHFKDIAGSI